MKKKDIGPHEAENLTFKNYLIYFTLKLLYLKHGAQIYHIAIHR
jgi:hypothetical protein